MPRNVRNVWIEGRADGGSKVAFGPRAGDGGARLDVLLRHNGSISAVSVRLEAYWCDGTITLDAYVDGQEDGVETFHGERGSVLVPTERPALRVVTKR